MGIISIYLVIGICLNLIADVIVDNVGEINDKRLNIIEKIVFMIGWPIIMFIAIKTVFNQKNDKN